MRGGTRGRRAGGGGRRREEDGLAGNMGTAEAEGQVTKEREWELRGADGGGRRGGWAGERQDNSIVSLPLSTHRDM